MSFLKQSRVVCPAAVMPEGMMLSMPVLYPCYSAVLSSTVLWLPGLCCAVLAGCCAVDLHTGVYYQKCYDPECRHYRSNTMPLPGDIWQAYRHMVQAQQQAQHGDHQQQRQQPSHLPSAQQLQSLSTIGVTTAVAAGAVQAEVAADDDEGMLDLLLHCEQQHLQQQLLQHDSDSSPWQQPRCVAEQEGSVLKQASVAGQQRCRGQGLPLGARDSTLPTEAVQDLTCMAGCADDETDGDTADDELYMQLLQAVEQQHVAQQGSKVAAS
jgi:hypothetical protein